jgi:lipoprotein NlpD
LRGILVGLALLAAAGCGSVSTQAPVDDRRPQAAARPPVAPATPSAQSAAAPAAPAVPAGHHVVKRGDTLYSIALEHGASYRDVAQWNQLDDSARSCA